MNGIDKIKMLSGAKPFESITNYIFIVTDDISNDILGVYNTMQKGKEYLITILSKHKTEERFDLVEDSESLLIIKSTENNIRYKIERFKIK